MDDSAPAGKSRLSEQQLRARWNAAIALYQDGRYADALARLEALRAHLPHDLVLLANLGVVSRDLGDLGRAERCLRAVCEQRPEDAAAHYNLALTLLRAGQLREGFAEYEWRWRLKEFAPQRREIAAPVWDGGPLGGRRILLYGEQGAGDTIQFVRYAPLVAAAGSGEVILEVLPHLERLMSWMDGGYRIVNALTERVGFDVQCALMSLPHRFSTGLDSIPPPARFRIPPGARDRWRARFAPGVRNIGVVWAGNPLNPNDAFRSIPPELFAPLAGLPGIRCFCLQVGADAAGPTAPAVVSVPGVEPLAGELADFANTAAAISCLDLVIAADTAVAHLAGSLSIPVWLLTAYASDWRWLLDREDSPWYSSLRIFRQKAPGDWAEVLARVAAEAARFVSARP
jgi:hypothetical protein